MSELCVVAFGMDLCIGVLTGGLLLAAVLVLGTVGAKVIVATIYAIAHRVIVGMAIRHAILSVGVGAIGLEALKPGTVIPFAMDALDWLLSLL